MPLAQLSNEDLIALKNKQYDKVSSDGLKALAAPAQPKFDDNQIADVPYSDRAVVENFGTSPESNIAYLQKQNPNMDFVQHNGQIYAKPTGIGDFQPLSSHPLTHPIQAFHQMVNDPTEALKTIGDSVVPVAKGVVDNLGGALAVAPEALAAPETLGASLMAAPATYAAARGLLGATTESGRQSLGQMLGIDNNGNTGNVVASGGLNAAMPLVADNIIKPAWDSTKSGVSSAVAKLGNYNPEVLKNLESNLLNISDILNKAGGIGQWLKDRSQTYADAMEAGRNKIGSDMLATVPDNIPTKDINLYLQKQAANQSNPEILRDAYNNLKGYIPNSELSPTVSNSANKTVSSAGISNFVGNKNIPVPLTPTASTMGNPNEATSQISELISGKLNPENLYNPNDYTGSLWKNEISPIVNGSISNGNTVSPSATKLITGLSPVDQGVNFNPINNSISTDKTIAPDIVEMLGGSSTSIPTASKQSIMNSKNLLYNLGQSNSALPAEKQAATDLSSQLRDTLVGNSSNPNLYEQKANQYGSLMGDVFDNNRSKIADSADKANQVLTTFNKPNLSAAQDSLNNNFIDNMTNLAKEGGQKIDPKSDAVMLQTLNDFANPSWVNDSARGVVPAASIGGTFGGLAGYLPTHNMFVGAGTGAAGAAMGAAAVSPAAIMKGLAAKNSIENGANNIATGLYNNPYISGGQTLQNLYNQSGN